MSVYFTSFYPLCHTAHGQQAIEKYKLKPYRDGSCRLEPDFEKEYPSITGLCRPRFSKALKPNDIVIYITNKTKGQKHIIAILKVIEATTTQLEAKQWYLDNAASLPQNLMVSPNIPLPLDHTTQIGIWGGFGTWGQKKKGLEEWDEFYKERAEANPHVAICERLYHELETPPLFDDITQQKTFGKIFNTHNYCRLLETQWNNFKELLITENIVSSKTVNKW